jgi:hypothetical protein
MRSFLQGKVLRKIYIHVMFVLVQIRSGGVLMDDFEQENAPDEEFLDDENPEVLISDDTDYGE